MKKNLALVLGVSVLMVVVVCGSTLFQSYRQTRLAAVDDAQNVTLIAQRAITRNLEILSLSLDALAQRYQHPLPSRALSKNQRAEYLFGSTANVSHISVMAILDAKGAVLVSSRKHPAAVAQNYADRPYFTAHRDAANIGLYVSRPLTANLGNDLKVVVLSKRLSKEDGSFDGIVLMALDLVYFRELFTGLALGADGVISLYSDDGVAYMRVPYRESIIGSDLSKNVSYQRVKNLLSDDEGNFFSRSTHDNISRLYTFKRVPQTPLLVFVGYSEATIFKNWRQTLYAVLFAFLIFAVISGVLFSYIRIELQRRHAIELQLQELVRTDGLTGLLNRRALDATLHATWERCQADLESSFSLLFIDVDYFKLYNDTYGHKSGDAVLQVVANIIAAHVSRNSGCAARYGGEEFVVLLEETSEEDAMAIAGRLCEAIHARGITHASSPLQVATASIGVAGLKRGVHMRIEDVINAADAALYQAKHQGRNRVQRSEAGLLQPSA